MVCKVYRDRRSAAQGKLGQINAEAGSSMPACGTVIETSRPSELVAIDQTGKILLVRRTYSGTCPQHGYFQVERLGDHMSFVGDDLVSLIFELGHPPQTWDTGGQIRTVPNIPILWALGGVRALRLLTLQRRAISPVGVAHLRSVARTSATIVSPAL